MTLNIDHSFDKETYRHFINGFNTVMHCHHYMSLTTKLADQFADCDGPSILASCAEDSIRPLLDDYFAKNGVTDVAAKLQVGADFYSHFGLGKMTVTDSGDGAGEAILTHSHVDEGWTQKYDKSDHPLNYFTCGFLSAMFAAANDKPARSIAVTEEESMATGAAQGRFVAKQA
jgi:hypothetical protein